MFEYSANPTPRAMILQLARAGIRSAVAFETEHTEHDKVGGDLTALRTALGTTASRLVEIQSELSALGLTKEAIQQVERHIKKPFELAQDGQRRAMAAIETEWSKLHIPRFDELSSPAVRAEQRTWARGLPMPKAMELANSDPAVAAAIVEGGLGMSGLPKDIFDRLRRSMAIGQLADAIGRQHDFRTEPTPDDPIGGATDTAAARKAAEARITSIEADKDTLSRVPSLLSNVVTAVALITEESRQAAFDRLTA